MCMTDIWYTTHRIETEMNLTFNLIKIKKTLSSLLFVKNVYFI